MMRSTIGIVYDIVRNGHWLTPATGRAESTRRCTILLLDGRTHCPSIFMAAADLHDAARLASGLYTLLALEFILLAARELHGREHAAAAPLILAGSIGFLFHAHEAQPMLAALTAHTAAYWAADAYGHVVRVWPRLIFGTALALGFL